MKSENVLCKEVLKYSTLWNCGHVYRPGIQFLGYCPPTEDESFAERFFVTSSADFHNSHYFCFRWLPLVALLLFDNWLVSNKRRDSSQVILIVCKTVVHNSVSCEYQFSPTSFCEHLTFSNLKTRVLNRGLNFLQRIYLLCSFFLIISFK